MPTDTCEKTSVKGQVYLTEAEEANYTFSPQIALIAICAANPVQFVFDILCIYLQKMRVNTESAKQNCKLLSYQCLVTLIFIYLCF